MADLNGQQDEDMSVAERAKRAAGLSDEQRAAEAEADQAEMFPLGSLEGDGRTLRNLMRPTLPITSTVSLRSAEVPLSGGDLLNPEKTGRALVTYLPEKYEEVAEHEGTEAVAWKVRQVARPVFVEPVKGDLPDMVEAWFDRVMEESPEAGGALADRIAAKAAARLSVA
jgi:hypothetical protein